ncbi:MAG: DUF3307 domain-containing protein [Endomicrobiia bacterium]|nr:DUF3307 domain-containing protein [Endomicrobiia bacterium]
MDLFWRLILAHFVGDFTLQTNKIAKWKRESVWGVLFHSLIFFALGALLTFHRANEIWVEILALKLGGWMCLVILTALHYLEDNWRVWTISRFNSPDSFGFFLWDQFIHYLMIFIFTPLDASITPERWVIVAIIYVLVGHFMTIFIYYIEKDVLGQAVIRTDLKYYSIIERLAIVSLFLLPGNWWLFMIALWILKSIIYGVKKIYDFSWIHIALNYTFAIIMGVAGKIVMNL